MAEVKGASVFFYIFSSSLILLLVTLLVKYVSTGTKNSSTKIQPPPSPPSLPIIGHLHLLGSVIPKSFQTLATKYGPLIKLRLGASTCIVVSNFQVAKEVMKDHDLNFCDRPNFGSCEYFLYKGSYFTTAPYGPYWRFMKKLCMTQLLSSSLLSCFMHIREEEKHKLLKSLMVCSSEGKASNLSLELTSLTNNILCRMAMSTTCFDEKDNDAKEIHGLVKEFLEVGAKLSMGEVFGPLGKLDLFGYGKKLVKIVGKFDQILEGILEEHEKEIEVSQRETKDMMDIMLQVYRDPNAEVKLTRNDMKAFFLDIFLAGTETSSVASQWAMAEIMNHPQVLKKLREEIDSVVGTCRLVNESDIPKLHYLKAIVKEVLRLHPTAPIALRQSLKDCNINGYNIKGQTRTLINVYAIMRDPKAWNNPQEFIPERFLEGSDYMVKMSSNDFRYIPFGFGRRGCPGESLSLRVIQGIIASLVQCFDWKVEGGDKVNMEEGSSFSVGLAMPLVCYPTTRFNLF
ncbi:hypothetical protein Lal_00036610 [Lupinus albus]|uniref:Putative 3,9-dihydroxypterocarpan 6A-monooxygenase n=1 Tax=Lupinus albus TaxID=3870 RepID=A0A6A4NSD6_LUPAL|nr:putative 3,9-dihydroxypterocarpan 6A-monooxygenase [Lupinus albus]KAF1892249.1 hypothetical protein Lal_00036610 [Lupinus albus]